MLEKICTHCGEPFTVDKCDLEFYERVSPIIGGKCFSVPPPTLCPQDRLRRRLAFRNQVFVFNRTSSLSGRRIFSSFPEGTKFPVYENEEWWGDSWDPLCYGRDLSPDEPFFAQRSELRDREPHMSRSAFNLENSDYCINSSSIRNCYLVVNTSDAEDCLYGENVWGSKDCVDCSQTKKSELCFDCTACLRCYNLQSSVECADCRDSYFLLNCRSCAHCFGCANLRQAEYAVFNQIIGKERFNEFISSLNLGSYQVRRRMQEQALSFWRTQPRPHISVFRSEEVSGNYISESRNVHDSYFINQGERLRYCLNLDSNTHDCYDASIPGVNSELLYETMTCGINSSRCIGCFWTYKGSHRCLYCYMCLGCEDCIGCVGLQQKKYCILNQQYTEVQYRQIAPLVIEHLRSTGEWGEFFPIELSPVPYNLSLAQRYFPLTREEIVAAGLDWHEHGEQLEAKIKVVENLPDILPEGSESIAARSERSGRIFRITSAELNYLRKFQAPLPRLSYEERMADRIRNVGGVRLHPVRCARSGRSLVTTHNPTEGWQFWDKSIYDEVYGS